MKTRRVGILTFHCTDNPGSVLQAYALQQIITELGAECDIINYQRKGWRLATAKQYLPTLKRRFGILGNLVWLGVWPMLLLRLLPYNRFRNKYMHFNSRGICRKEELSQIEKRYDKLVTGSDQVWNLDNVKVDTSFFLDFVQQDEKKISYAASFGQAQLPEKYVESVKPLLALFAHLSVREKQGQEIVRELADREAELVLDPTLLRDRKQWELIAKTPKEQGYILVYLRKISPSIASFVTLLSAKTGLPVVQITGWKKRVKQGKRIFSPGPRTWLGCFLNASYVVTNSFHGVAFSVNFKKQFFVEPMLGSQSETNSRIYSILDQFGLRDRIIGENTLKDAVGEIDYGPINLQIKEKREKSLQFLREALFEGDVNE